MEEDVGVKVPVTRLRRQLSVEQSDEQQSSPAPSTPTKKRSTLAIKPQLELIDEHAVTDSPKLATRKSVSRVITATAEKPVTPAHRSSRLNSNTSLVSEAEEKLITPSRRSTRIKSNTSIVSEASQSVESPRAKRAATRRNSQIGSDTEAPVTPARIRRTRQASLTSADKDSSRTPIVNDIAVTPSRTRRTRKGSTSSIDTPAEEIYADKPASLITVIVEEPDNQPRKSTSNVENDNIDNRDNLLPTRKSPRLMAKKGCCHFYVSGKCEDTIENVSQKNRITEDTNQDTKTSSEATHNDISINSANLINDLDKKTKKIFKKNKSMSEIDDKKAKHHRTKSWTTLCASPSNLTDSIFYSDNEKRKKKIKQCSSKFKFSDTGSGDGLKKNIVEQKEDKESDSTVNPTKNSRKIKDKSFSANIPVNETIVDTKDADKSDNSNKENILGVFPPRNTLRAVDLLFEQHPSAVQTVVFLEDSDSNTGDKQLVGDDQCVPVALQPSNTQPSTTEKPENIFAINSENISCNHSVEPMDIDDTMPENVSLSVFTAESKQTGKSSISAQQEAENISDDSSNKSKRKSLVHSISQIVEKPNTDEVSNQEKLKKKKERKSSTSMSPHVGIITKTSMSSSLQVINIKYGVNESIDVNSKGKRSRESSLSHELGISIDTPNKSKTKSSLSSSTSLDHDKSPNDNKSTLLLSQIKYVSAAENSVSKSPQVVNELSKSLDIQNIGKDELVSKNITLNYLTSTPVQQKHFEKLGISMNSSITPTWGNKKETNKLIKEDLFTKKTTVNDSSAEDSDKSNDDESSQDKSNLLDDEAEDARDDYESGDSQDEDERQYEAENEIVDKGETLSFEEEISNYSDYEKNSFIASSDEEQNSLLSGTGDDLSSSDNELKMSSKSKQKYNERKLKEQKKASREMYEARHGFKKLHSDKTNKNNRNRLDSTLLKSDEENLPPKKHKRIRLESTFETDPEETYKTKDTALDAEEIGYKKKKSKRLSESLYNENTVNEKEITIFNQEVNDKDDPLTINVKQEPKTPQKDFEMSTVQINDEMEQILIDKDVSMMKAIDSLDPLQATMPQNENHSDDDDSVSENEEITNNYDYVLKELNKESKKLIKSRDSSLNLNKKLKQKKAAIVAKLNLTQTNVSKNDETKRAKEKTTTRVFKKLADNNDSSSDSINLKLLFSDESDERKEKDKNLEKNEVTEEEYFIPLKRTEAKTDIRRSIGANETSSNESSLDRSTNKITRKTKSKSVKMKNTDDLNADDDGVVSFFIDTTGDLAEKGSNGNGAESKSDDDDPPIEIFYTSKKNKKQSQNAAESENSTKDITQTKTPGSQKKITKGITDLGSPPPNTPVSEKKKKIHAEHEDNIIAESDKQMSKTPMSEKKKKKSSESHDEPHTTESRIQGPKTPKSEKKKKKSSESHDETQTTESMMQGPETLKGEKKKRKSSESHDEPQTTESMMQGPKTPKSEKKKKKSSESHEEPQTTESMMQGPKTPKSAKKKKKSSESHDEPQTTESIIPGPKTPKSEKKKKKSSESHDEPQTTESTMQGPETPKSEKKKKKSSESHDEPQTTESMMQGPKTPKSEKKKKKSSESHDEPQTTESMMQGPKTPKGEKKKRKSSESHDEPQSTESMMQGPKTPKSEKKKMKSSESHDEPQTTESMMQGPKPKSAKNKKKSSGSHDEPKNTESMMQGPETPKSEKKKKKSSESHDEPQTTESIIPGPKTPKSEKKKKKSSESHDEPQTTESMMQGPKTPKSEKKKKKSSESHDEPQTTESMMQGPKTPKSEKKKKKSSESHDEPQTTESMMQGPKTPKSAKKKKKSSESHDEPQTTESIIPGPKTPKSEKKKKKSSESHDEPQTTESTMQGPETPKSEKKKKKSSESHDETQTTESMMQGPETLKGEKNKKYLSNEVISYRTQLSKTPATENKKKKVSKQEEIVIVTENNDAKIAKKRKRLSANQSSADISFEGTLNTSPNSNVLSNKKKKMKRSDRTEDLFSEKSSFEAVQINSKERIKHSNVDKESTAHESGFETEANKKRTYEDDIKRDKQNKILKVHSFDKIHVPRLPSSIIDQLEEKPHQEIIQKKKSKIVSTTDFVVEKKKTNTKPSNFLEETVYLNDDDVNETVKKQKKHILNKPKVLPFQPTVSTSDSGFTTKFQVKVITEKMEFVGQCDQVPNFRNQYLDNNRLKKLRSRVYNKHRKMNLSKY